MNSLRSCVLECFAPLPPPPQPPVNPTPIEPPPIRPPPVQPEPLTPGQKDMLAFFDKQCVDRGFSGGFDRPNLTCSLKGVSSPCGPDSVGICCNEWDTCVKPILRTDPHYPGDENIAKLNPEACQRAYKDCHKTHE